MTCPGLFEIAFPAVVLLLTVSCTCLNNPIAPAGGAEGAAELGEPVDVEFIASIDQTPQRYVKRLPKDFDPRRRHDVLIALHGRGSDRWQYAKHPRDECRGARAIAARYGMIFISPDYRGLTAGMNAAAEADMVQIIAMIRREHSVGKVFLTGGSMGGMSVLAFAAHHGELIDGVASANGRADLLFKEPDDPAAAPDALPRQLDTTGELAPEFTPEKFTMPVAFTLGGRDTMVPPDSVRRLYASLRDRGKRDVLIIDRPEGGHATDFPDTVASLTFVIEAAYGR